ncbi:glycine cleavage system aminomethyltransferase GcvT [Methylonatrum kenyense]|uniref:glycine cleavage system aminomethyltransferase GcvT n=1 Tax=Methylonatrum kenyense TaxID=455253 RepID=UPI0020BEB512|nr:glycine cleavage system aminomethyltransferase GcvT [Methylonatrum kenyense]MCK8516577.1 glycine cleavage system aminomethyltransferase GcvT [Methylonatrum kenyense]
MSSAQQQTPLNALHRAAGARMIDFSAWDMPLHYGSQLREHAAVRSACGVFDVSHMGLVDVAGDQAEAFLRRLLANDVARLDDGRALYSCMLNVRGGVLDDLIVYRLQQDRFRCVINAANRASDMDWMLTQGADFNVHLRLRDDLGLLAVQGPQAADVLASLLESDLGDALRGLEPFGCLERGAWLLGRTGYTGEDGFEVAVPAAQLAGLWQGLMNAGVAPCGLGARDSLRLEAGMHLYGQDMDASTSPLVSRLGWTVAWQPETRDFIGRQALATEREAGPDRNLFGLVLQARGMLRQGQAVALTGRDGGGVVTSGGYSPQLGCSIGLARLPLEPGETVVVQSRQRLLEARVVRPPFVRHGRVLVSSE